MDRNICMLLLVLILQQSLSARRAWIEIPFRPTIKNRPSSLSARRAWIEIIKLGGLIFILPGRSPQGERG